MILESVFNKHKDISNRTLTLDCPDGWNTGQTLFGGAELQAMKLPAVNACIEIIADSIAKMPIYLMDSKTRERVTDNPVLELLTSRPNEIMTAFDYFKLMESRRIAYGNAYAIIIRDKFGIPCELLPVEAGYMTPFIDDKGKLWYVGTNPKTGEYRKFWDCDIIHYKAFSVDGIEGVSYLKRGAMVIEAALQSQKYEKNFYANGARLTGVLTTETDLTNKPEIVMEDGSKISIKDSIRASWDKIYSGADNAYRTAVLDFGMKYTPISASNKDAQFIESKAASIEDIGRLFNIPLYKLGVGKQTYASNVQASIEYMQRTLSPIVAPIEQEDTYKLLTIDQRTKLNLQIRRNMMGELRGDWASRADWYRTMSDIGVYSVNDIRQLEDMTDVKGGDARKASLNFVPLHTWEDLSVKRNEGGENK